ncbi:hypothetical protein ACC745_39445, partial [Rhizobium ruizarguesonis]
TYSLCEGSNAVIIYGTKTGVEMTAKGIPVIVAGEAWIRNKGLTLDADTPENYLCSEIRSLAAGYLKKAHPASRTLLP